MEDKEATSQYEKLKTSRLCCALYQDPIIGLPALRVLSFHGIPVL